MPRPKPAIPINERSVRLTDLQWAKLQALGGSTWLRSFLENMPSPEPPHAALQNVWNNPQPPTQENPNETL